MTDPVNTRPYVSSDPGRPAARDIGRIGTFGRVGFLAAAATLGAPSIWYWVVGLGVLPSLSSASLSWRCCAAPAPAQCAGAAPPAT